MDINEIAQITVEFKRGNSIVYKKKGIEKLRKLLARSPPLKDTNLLIVDDDDGDIPEDQYQRADRTERGETPSNPPILLATQPGTGHTNLPLNYEYPKGASFTDRLQMAKQMQKQAESRWDSPN